MNTEGERLKTIMIAIRENGNNGGPNNSHLRIMESSLKEKYRFVPLIFPKGRMRIFNKPLHDNLVGQIKAVNPDAVHIIGLELVGYHLTVACKRAGVKRIILAIHGSSSESIEIQNNPPKNLMMRLLERYTLSKASITYGVSRYVGEIDVVNRFSKNYYGHIYNMLLPVDDNKADHDNEFNFPGDALVIVSTGRIVIEKGYGVLTDVIRHYKGDLRYRFIIAGNGNYLPVMKSELKEQIEAHQVILTGFIDDVTKVLTVGDVFVMPSFHETLCMSLIEAGQYGLALIASKVGGMKEVIDDGESGFLCEAGDADSFIEHIDYFQNNRDKLAEYKTKAKKYVEEKFDNTGAVKKLDELYDQLFEKGDLR